MTSAGFVATGEANGSDSDVGQACSATECWKFGRGSHDRQHRDARRNWAWGAGSSTGSWYRQVVNCSRALGSLDLSVVAEVMTIDW